VIVKKVDTYRTCAVCHRTLLLGERALRYSPGGDDWVDVCALCTEEANEHGWVREGSPTAPVLADGRRRRRRLPHLGILDSRRADTEPAAPEPILRRLSAPEQAMVEAAELFDQSPFKRTVAGIAKSLGEPRVSLLPLSGTNPEVVITVAWDISWYQYRVLLGSNPQPIRLAERGYEIDELDPRFKVWNGTLEASGRVVPDIPRI
jgi:hypothetical protein